MRKGQSRADNAARCFAGERRRVFGKLYRRRPVLSFDLAFLYAQRRGLAGGGHLQSDLYAERSRAVPVGRIFGVACSTLARSPALNGISEKNEIARKTEIYYLTKKYGFGIIEWLFKGACSTEQPLILNSMRSWNDRRQI